MLEISDSFVNGNRVTATTVEARSSKSPADWLGRIMPPESLSVDMTNDLSGMLGGF